MFFFFYFLAGWGWNVFFFGLFWHPWTLHPDSDAHQTPDPEVLVIQVQLVFSENPVLHWFTIMHFIFIPQCNWMLESDWLEGGHYLILDHATAEGANGAGGMDQVASTVHSDQSECCTPAVPFSIWIYVFIPKSPPLPHWTQGVYV